MVKPLTDEEIRVKVAELMGVKPLRCGWLAFNPETQGIAFQADFRHQIDDWLADGFQRRKTYVAKEDLRVPDYLNDPAAALQLCDRMHSEGWTVEQIRRPGEDWIVSLFKGVIAGPSTTDPSLARAVTLCFLKCHE